jgi:6-phosphogluconolactonase/glucosamine-6-phosphate isomerase/deaminase
MTLRVEVLDEWADVVARRWEERLRPALRMCVPTGSTPQPVYRRLSTRFENTTVVLLDEFGVETNSPASCRSMIERHLLSRLRPRPALEALHPGAEDLEAECRRFSELARGALDLCLLGLGRNGHLGLNEPGSEVDSMARVVDLAVETREAVRGYGADPPPTWGMTLGIAEVLSAKEIWLLVTGAHKADILRSALDEPIGKHLPATFLRSHANAVVLADREAAAHL